MRKTYEQMIKCNCDTANTLAIIGGKWKILILYHLSKSNKGFNELCRLLSSITPHTLSKDLKELIEDELVKKTILQDIPPKTSYTLTDKGRELETVLIEIKKFGHKYPINKYNNLDKSIVDN
ncbi:winged helix-turn-helix transcriptional regulator [Enterococcus sp. AZ101]|uniref:winged helix-turn-helix transcriptional regulator n=1 Tax=Enterococcus sp. AZ101 TaxID=2774742 RepID=UPI003D2751BD